MLGNARNAAGFLETYKNKGGGLQGGVAGKQSCHCLIPVALQGGSHLEPGDNLLDFISSSPALPEAANTSAGC